MQDSKNRGEVGSGVFRGSGAVIGVVEGLSHAYNTTKNKATTYENNDDDNNDNGTDAARRATFNAPVMRGFVRLPFECGAIQEAGMIPSDMSVPAHSLDAPASAVLPGHDSHSQCAAPPRPPFIVGSR